MAVSYFYSKKTLKAIKGPGDIVRCSLFSISLSSLSPNPSFFTSSPCVFFFRSSYLYFTASLVSVSLRCHLVPSKAHLPLAQVSSVLSVQRRERVFACICLCVGGLFHCYTAVAMCCIVHMFQ